MSNRVGMLLCKLFLYQRRELRVRKLPQFFGIYDDLGAPHAGADGDLVVQNGCFFYISGELLFHPDGGASASHVALSLIHI